MSVPDKFRCLCVVVNSCGLWWHERLDDVSTTLSFLLASSVADRRRVEKLERIVLCTLLESAFLFLFYLAEGPFTFHLTLCKVFQ